MKGLERSVLERLQGSPDFIKGCAATEAADAGIGVVFLNLAYEGYNERLFSLQRFQLGGYGRNLGDYIQGKVALVVGSGCGLGQFANNIHDYSL